MPFDKLRALDSLWLATSEPRSFGAGRVEWRRRELNPRTERFGKRFYKFSPSGKPSGRFCLPVLTEDTESGSPPRTRDMTPEVS